MLLPGNSALNISFVPLLVYRRINLLLGRKFLKILKRVDGAMIYISWNKITAKAEIKN